MSEKQESMTITWRLEAVSAQDAVDQIAAELERRAKVVRDEAKVMRGYDARLRKFHGVTLEQIACKFTEAATLENQVNWLRKLRVDIVPDKVA